MARSRAACGIGARRRRGAAAGDLAEPPARGSGPLGRRLRGQGQQRDRGVRHGGRGAGRVAARRAVLVDGVGRTAPARRRPAEQGAPFSRLPAPPARPGGAAVVSGVGAAGACPRGCRRLAPAPMGSEAARAPLAAVGAARHSSGARQVGRRRWAVTLMMCLTPDRCVRGCAWVWQAAGEGAGPPPARCAAARVGAVAGEDAAGLGPPPAGGPRAERDTQSQANGHAGDAEETGGKRGRGSRCSRSPRAQLLASARLCAQGYRRRPSRQAAAAAAGTSLASSARPIGPWREAGCCEAACAYPFSQGSRVVLKSSTST